MRIDGTVVGNIDIDGVLNLSETGRVEGDILCGSTRIAGRVNGNIYCRNAIHLAATADVTGNITTTNLIIDEGAIFLGTCQTHVTPEEAAAY